MAGARLRRKKLVFDDIFVRAPVNKLAAVVVSQKGVAETDTPLTREELARIVERLGRKQRLLKRVLGIANKSQHRNAIWKDNKRLIQYRAQNEPRAFVEYRRIGQEMARLNVELAEMRKCRRLAAWYGDKTHNAAVTGGESEA